jgi:hypothetical protein
MTEEIKSLSQWRFEIKRFGKPHWGRFYTSLVGFPVSNYPRFYKAINQYGESIFFDSIVAASDKKFESDPLNYVIKIAHTKWKEQEAELDASEEYEAEIDKAKKESRRRSEELQTKLDKARRINSETEAEPAKMVYREQAKINGKG